MRPKKKRVRLTLDLESGFSPGLTVARKLEGLADHLEDDGIGLCDLIYDSEVYFDLSGEEQNEFICWCIVAICRLGGRPKDFDRQTQTWIEVPYMGTTPEDIARNVVQDWIIHGRPKLDFYKGIRFRLAEDHYHPNRPPAGA